MGNFESLLHVLPNLEAKNLFSEEKSTQTVNLNLNVTGTLYGDGGLMASKPYVATGKYIQRMGGPCASCRYNPALREGDTACPFTTLYWDFLIRHASLMKKNPRMALQVRNLEKLTDAQKRAVRERATQIRAGTVGKLTDAADPGQAKLSFE